MRPYHLFQVIVAICAVVALAGEALAEAKPGTWSPDFTMYRSNTKVGGSHPTLSACQTAAVKQAVIDGTNKTSGRWYYTCRSSLPVDFVVPAPTPPPPPVPVDSALLTWTTPLSNTDGSALTDLKGYAIYYGTSPDMLYKSVFLQVPGATAYRVEQLDRNRTWYFSVSVINSKLEESRRSGVVSKVIN